MTFVYVTIITNNKYIKGIKALIRSLKKARCGYPLVVLVPNDAGSELVETLNSLDCIVKTANRPSVDLVLRQQNRIETWNDTFFKLSVFDLEEYKKVIYIDSDMMVLNNLDVLFEKPHLSAVAAGQLRDPSWNRLNSGLMVIEPDHELYCKLVDAILPACSKRLVEGSGYGDQDVINYCYQDWPKRKDLHLSERYNCLLSDIEIVAAEVGFKSIAVIHYIGVRKIWEYSSREKQKEIIRLIRGRHWKSLLCLLRYMYYLR